MKVLAILALTLLGFWLITVKWGFLSVFCALAIWLLIRSDKGDRMLNDFFAWCFAFAVAGVIGLMMGF